ncbi:salivary lipocalin-like [Apodemus sylvaticus]|uniref:salivary lipocalin-like n=1 Tax=Apodemus sylvaticus TaxID=10129 RepID=UPI0022448ED2|nr:salivary lipocalin-like [Apodemus sylvaticus]
MKLLLLLSVGLGLTWTLQDQTLVPVQQGFHPEQVIGSWYTLILASTDPSAIEEGGAYLCYMTGIVLLDNGSLNVTYFHREDGQCVKNFYIAEETDTPGRYTFEYHGKNYLTFVEVTEDFIIIDLENQSEEGSLIVTELHGKTLSTDDIGWDHYYSYICRRGIEIETTVELPLSDCPSTPSRKQGEPY